MRRPRGGRWEEAAHRQGSFTPACATYVTVLNCHMASYVATVLMSWPEWHAQKLHCANSSLKSAMDEGNRRIVVRSLRKSSSFMKTFVFTLSILAVCCVLMTAINNSMPGPCTDNSFMRKLLIFNGKPLADVDLNGNLILPHGIKRVWIEVGAAGKTYLYNDVVNNPDFFLITLEPVTEYFKTLREKQSHERILILPLAAGPNEGLSVFNINPKSHHCNSLLQSNTNYLNKKLPREFIGSIRGSGAHQATS
eukprot:8892056-Pyramimonas_sp.AAC.1